MQLLRLVMASKDALRAMHLHEEIFITCMIENLTSFSKRKVECGKYPGRTSAIELYTRHVVVHSRR